MLINFENKLNFIISQIRANQLVTAEKDILKLLKSYPNNEKLIYQLAIIKFRTSNLDEAIYHLTELINNNNNNKEKNHNYYFNRGLTFQKRFLNTNDDNDYSNAICDYKNAISLHKNDHRYYYQYATMLRANGDHIEAIKFFSKASRLKEDYYSYYLDLGISYYCIDDYNNAKINFQKAHKVDPTQKESDYYLSMLYLKNGNFIDGWKLWNSRWKSKYFKSKHLVVDKNKWDGEKNIKNLLIWNEQGIGDEIMCSIFFPRILDKVNNISIICDARLINVFKNSFSDKINFYTKEADLSKINFDEHIPMFDLPKLFINDLSLFTHNKGKIIGDDKKVLNIKKKASTNNKKIIGLSWFTKNIDNRGRTRNFDLSEIIKSFLPNSDDYIFLNLQYNFSQNELNKIKNDHGVEIYTDNQIDYYNDIEDITNLVAACDYIISIDNYIIHLAGAMGKKTHVLLSRPWDWRWFDGRNLWYDNMVLHIQEKDQDKYQFLKNSLVNITNSEK